jgi:hypothetical protein
VQSQENIKKEGEWKDERNWPCRASKM